jgi:WD40 repeat protein
MMPVFSPDGKLLASASRDQTLRLWDPATAQPLGEPLEFPHNAPPGGLEFSPDGRFLALSTLMSDAPGAAKRDTRIKIWDVSTRREAAVLGGHPQAVLCLAFSHDGKFLATGGGRNHEYGEVKLWEVGTWKERAILGGFSLWVESLSFSRDSSTLTAAGSSGGLRGQLRSWDLSPWARASECGECGCPAPPSRIDDLPRTIRCPLITLRAYRSNLRLRSRSSMIVSFSRCAGRVAPAWLERLPYHHLIRLAPASRPS